MNLLRQRIIQIGFLLVCTTSSIQSGLAARIGVIDQKEAPLYETIGENPKIKSFLKRGAEVRASNYPTNGFYKVESGRQQGWIRSDQIILKEGIILKPAVVEATLPQNQDQPFIGQTQAESEKGRPVAGSKNVVKTRDKGVRTMWRR